MSTEMLNKLLELTVWKEIKGYETTKHQFVEVLEIQKPNGF